MVNAILAGTKSQTRRIVKHGTPDDWNACPFGVIGDRLWVRETWDFLPDSGPDEPNAAMIRYWAGGDMERRIVPSDFNPFLYNYEKKRSPIHMPRWASRITLEITGVRVQRLQEISTADAIAEGIKVHPDFHDKPRDSLYSPAQAYRDLWDQIHGADAWEKNPWVWALEFKRA